MFENVNFSKFCEKKKLNAYIFAIIAIVKSIMGGFKRLVVAHLVLIEIYQMTQKKIKSVNIWLFRGFRKKNKPKSGAKFLETPIYVSYHLNLRLQPYLLRNLL